MAVTSAQPSRFLRLPYRRRLARCEGCGIFVGPGYISQQAHPTPDGRGIVCGSCARALGTRARLGEAPREVLNAWRQDLARKF